MALGADKPAIARLVIGEGLRLTLAETPTRVDPAICLRG
jgi:hypothetical protein